MIYTAKEYVESDAGSYKPEEDIGKIKPKI